MLASIRTYALAGVEAREVTVEVDIQLGLPAFNIVGLPDAALRESRERVRSALKNSGFEFPLKRITVNLAPADLHKAGPSFDLAVACAILVASEQVNGEGLTGYAVCGELALDGGVRPVNGTLVFAAGAREAAMENLIVPLENVEEALLVDGVKLIGLKRLEQIKSVADGSMNTIGRHRRRRQKPPPTGVDLADVRGHAGAKRALELTAAGGHNLLMIGPPGSGKTMLARRLPGIMPPLRHEEAVEATRIHSVAGALNGSSLIERRPFRAPHHSISPVALVGGGNPVRPGEISMAHNGVLFLDELAEFSRMPLEALRQPLEDGHITVMRASGSFTFPARFTMVAATNPCPCGFAGDRKAPCACTPAALNRYRLRMSGPLLDRIDIMLRIDRPRLEELHGESRPEVSGTVLERVIEARERQVARLSGDGIGCNAQMGSMLVRRHCRLSKGAEKLLVQAEGALTLGGRGYVRILRLARTAADLRSSETIEVEDMAAAVTYRHARSDEAAA